MESKERFDTFVRENFESVVAIPGAQTIYYYYVDVKEKIFRKWSDIVPDYTYTKEVPYFQVRNSNCF